MPATPEPMEGRHEQQGVFDAIAQLQRLIGMVKPEDIERARSIINAIDPEKIRSVIGAVRTIGDTIQIDLRLILPK